MCVDRRNYLIPQLHLMPFSRHCQCENQNSEMMAAFSWLGFAFTWRNHHPALRGTGDRPPEARLQKRANAGARRRPSAAFIKSSRSACLSSLLLKATFRWTVASGAERRKIECLAEAPQHDRLKCKMTQSPDVVIRFRKKLCAFSAFYLPPPTEAPSFKRRLKRCRLCKRTGALGT